METLTLKQANKIIIEQINESNLFNRPEIDFILFNDREETSQTLIGVHEQDNPSLSYIYILETKDAIPMKDIKVYKKDDTVTDLYNKDFEGYFLLQIENEEIDINFVSLDFHIRLWNYIASLDNDIRHKYFSLKYYVVYCKENGINYKLLNIYSKNELEDIIGEFYLMYDEDDFFNIVENFNWTIISTLFEENKKNRLKFIKVLVVSRDLYYDKGIKNTGGCFQWQLKLVSTVLAVSADWFSALDWTIRTLNSWASTIRS